MQDNANIEKRQAEALSAAIDALNRGGVTDDNQESELEELLVTARLVKDAAKPLAGPPQAVIDNIVNQAANTISRQKRKKRLAWGFAGLSGAVAAVLLVALLNVVPQVGPEQQLAKTPPLEPGAVIEMPPPSTITNPPPNLISPETRGQAPASPAKQESSAKTTPESAAATQPPSVALVPPTSPVPAESDTMLALAERRADVVTIDAASKIIRQVYRQGAPDEIIITQAPKRQAALRIVPDQSGVKVKMAVPIPNESVEIKPPNRNKVTVTVDNSEVTLEGTATEEELLKLSKTLTKVSVTK